LQTTTILCLNQQHSHKLQLLNVDEESLQRCCGAPIGGVDFRNARHCETIFLPLTVAVAVVLSQALKLVSSAASTPSSQRHENRNHHRQTNGDIATGNRR
jgi:hypothetical protein